MNKYKGLFIPEGNETVCQAYSFEGLICGGDCLFGNEDMLKTYLKLKERKLKLKKLNEIQDR